MERINENKRRGSQSIRQYMKGELRITGTDYHVHICRPSKGMWEFLNRGLLLRPESKTRNHAMYSCVEYHAYGLHWKGVSLVEGMAWKRKP
jgi:hypothetical protein